jgi:hypothetical protein
LEHRSLHLATELVALDRAAADDLAAENTLRTLRQELATVQHHLEEYLQGPNNSKAEITAARAEVTDASAARDRAMVDWRITSEVLRAAETNFRQAFSTHCPPCKHLRWYLNFFQRFKSLNLKSPDNPLFN